MEAKGRRDQLGSEGNPHLGEASVLQGLVASETAALEAAKSGAAQWQQEAEWARELDAAFGRTGVQSFALEGVLGELQVRGLLLSVETERMPVQTVHGVTWRMRPRNLGALQCTACLETSSVRTT